MAGWPNTEVRNLLPKIVDAEKHARSMSEAGIAGVLDAVDNYESPFTTAPERSAPEWLKPGEVSSR